MKKIISSIVVLVMALTVMTGSTYSLFSSEDGVSIAITSGKVNVVAEVDKTSLQAFSKGVEQPASQDGGVYFENGGAVSFDEKDNLVLNCITPGDKATFKVKVENKSNVNIAYRTILSIDGDLAFGLVAKVDGEKISGTNKTAWTSWDVVSGYERTLTFEVELPMEATNDYQDKKAVISFAIEAVQGNADMPDEWDGSVDTSWYNDTDTEFTLNTAEQVAGLSNLVDGGNDFVGKTIKLDGDLDLGATDENGNRVQFNPIGHSSNDKAFKGTFDGQGHTICNLYQQSDLGAWQYEGEYYGLFAYTDGATIKNVNVDGAYISSGKNEAASVVGNAVDTKFENINIANTTLIAYNNSAGGVAAECYGNCSFTNITVDENTVVGPLWGTYDVRLGGIVGLVQAGNNVTFKDITVACKLDAINDVAANYQNWLYRYCGMLIGHVDSVNGVADPTGYVTCENVKVIYGDWVNYHYCEDAELGAGSYNGPGEYKYARVEAGTGTDGIDLSSCNHNEDESHNVLIVFDQLFGGGQGIAGMKTYDGVEVVYNNK